MRDFSKDPKPINVQKYNGLPCYDMAEFEQRTRDAAMEDIVTEARDGPADPFIAFAIDILDPVLLPASGTPEPGGLGRRAALPMVRRLRAESKVVGCALVEFNPLVDSTCVYAMKANRIVRENRTGMAMRKVGLTDKHCFSSPTTNHG